MAQFARCVQGRRYHRHPTNIQSCYRPGVSPHPPSCRLLPLARLRRRSRHTHQVAFAAAAPERVACRPAGYNAAVLVCHAVPQLVLWWSCVAVVVCCCSQRSCYSTYAGAAVAAAAVLAAVPAAPAAAVLCLAANAPPAHRARVTRVPARVVSSCTMRGDAPPRVRHATPGCGDACNAPHRRAGAVAR